MPGPSDALTAYDQDSRSLQPLPSASAQTDNVAHKKNHHCHHAPELDAIDLLADTWDTDLDPEVCAKLVQANVRAYLSFGKEKGESNGEGKFPVRSSRLPLSDRGQQLRELRERTECNACGRKGHWAHDYECALFVSEPPDTHCCSYDDTTRSR